ncbi:unnamed protein product [Microthlaspi erraticum]|uniref:Uncharacterized protein n=1 Tax=Microthlaspi erraticum TaxID=1685480 RepID=A0A6D2ISB2_9BRAS|nr:unnamed protein product [Microthlaspi erraticum]
MSMAPPPPTVRAPLTILSCESTENHVPLDDSIEQRFPKVKVDWVGERVRVESVCDCNGGCRFTREEGVLGAVEVIAKLTSAL